MEFDAIDDERRLLYVAMTRAKHRLLLSSSETSIEGKVLIASRFFEDMSDQLQQIQTNTSVEDFDPLEQLQETLAVIPMCLAPSSSKVLELPLL